jgi:DNA-binding transcriptional LysR family regulator
MEMREQVRLLVEDAQVLLRPTDRLDLLALTRAFTLRTSDGITETFGPAIIQRVRQEAPGVQLRFVRKLDKGSQGLRDGAVDLETGVVDAAIGPEIRAQALFTDRYIGAVCPDHPLARGAVTSADYAGWSHVIAWREGLNLGHLDELLEDVGLSRVIMATVDGFSAALALARASDLIATVPDKHTEGLRTGMHTFRIPLPVSDFTISLLWHPRLDGDPAHRWLRDIVRDACRPASAGN